MHEFELIKKYFSPLSLNNKSSLDLNDDVFFNKSKKLAVSVDTYVEGVHFINFKNLTCNKKNLKIFYLRLDMQRNLSKILLYIWIGR